MTRKAAFALTVMVLLGSVASARAQESAEKAVRVSLTTQTFEVRIGQRVPIHVRVLDGVGTPLPRAPEVHLRVVRTARSAADAPVHGQPHFQELPAADLRVVSSQPTDVVAMVTMPKEPDALVTIAGVLDADTPRAVQNTLTILGVVRLDPVPRSATPTPVSVQAIHAFSRVVPPPPLPKRLAIVTTIMVGSGIVGTSLLELLALIPDIRFLLYQSLVVATSVVIRGRRKTAEWGVVVESSLYRPIARGLVHLFSAADGKIRYTVPTSRDGHFAFLPRPGQQYHILVRAPGYVYPARRQLPDMVEPGRPRYHGEQFLVTESTLQSPPGYLVVVDRGESVPRFHALVSRGTQIFRGVGAKALPLLVVAGWLWNTLVLFWFPTVTTAALEVLYTCVFLLHLRVLLTRAPCYGEVLEAEGRRPVSLALVRAYDNASNRLVQTSVTDQKGRFFLFLPTGIYTLAVVKDGYGPVEDTIANSRERGSSVVTQTLLLPQRATTPA